MSKEMDRVEMDKFLALREKGDISPKMYLQCYHELVSNINGGHFNSFFATLKEREGESIKNLEKLTNGVRSYILNELLKLHDHFWRNGDVAETLIALEMYEAHARKCESDKRKGAFKRGEPMGRTRPIRMHMKQKTKQFLEAQIKNQAVDIQNTLKTNSTHRESLTKIAERRQQLRDRMKECRANFETHKMWMLETTKELLFHNSSETN